MARPRSQIVDLDVTPYYFVTCRCVRKAFLLHDSHFDRRKAMYDRIALLKQTFAIDVAAFSLMSNHYHCVLTIHSMERKTSYQPLVERLPPPNIYKGLYGRQFRFTRTNLIRKAEH